MVLKIEMFRIIKGFDIINAENYITFDRSNITRRRNSFKVTCRRFSSNEAKHFFFNRVANIWNFLPVNVVDGKTITTFKNRLDQFLEANLQLKFYP